MPYTRFYFLPFTLINLGAYSMKLLFISLVSRLQQAWLILCITLFTPVISYAAITAPTIDGASVNDPIGAGKAVSKGLGEIFIYLLFIVGFIAAAWAAIDGLFRGLRKGEWGQFAVALGAALVMLVFVGWVLSQGETALTNLA
jgi:hypothetical protein